MHLCIASISICSSGISGWSLSPVKLIVDKSDGCCSSRHTTSQIHKILAALGYKQQGEQAKLHSVTCEIPITDVRLLDGFHDRWPVAAGDLAEVPGAEARRPVLQAPRTPSNLI